MMQQEAAISLPTQPTSFIGRDKELHEIAGLLSNPDCRLLTLVGPGGSGKTRLAIEAARWYSNEFVSSVFFVGLQPVQSAAFLASAIADAIQYPLRGQEHTSVQLLRYMRGKEMLLVLDNFEHLQAGAGLLADIVGSTPLAKLLVTSREVLSLREEWLYPVEGMSVPEHRDIEECATYDAVQLFVEHAQRVRRDFSLEAEFDSVIQICRSVQGMPLAIEIAASWLKVLPCEVIATEIQRNLDFLKTSLRNIPERHRSMRAVFEQSWHILSGEERDVFKRLSVFRGGFQREAAEQVAGASLPVLSALVDKSLLRREPDGRYQIHELLRQYAEEQLEERPDEAAYIRDLHRSYYAEFLARRANLIVGSHQIEVTSEISADLENIRTAWRRAVEQSNVTDIQKAAYPFSHFGDTRGYYQEIADAFEKAIESVRKTAASEQRNVTLAVLNVMLGYDYIRLGRYDDARDVFNKSKSIFDSLSIPPPPGFATNPLNGLALLASVLGNYEEAITLGEIARQRGEAHDDLMNLQITYYTLANSTLAQGQYEAAWDYARQAYSMAEQTGHRWMMAYILTIQGNIARQLGKLELARQHYQASHDIKHEFNDPEGMAAALNHLAKVAWLRSDLPEAERLYKQSLKIYREIGDRGGLAASLLGLGDTTQASGDDSTARSYFYEALQVAAEIQWIPLILSILVSVSNVLLRSGQLEQCAEILALAMDHPASDQETKNAASAQLSSVKTSLSPDQYTAAVQRGKNAQLETTISDIQNALLVQNSRTNTEQTTQVTIVSNQSLVDPLTERELEILRLMAEGLTNQQIADRLVVVIGTVKSHNHNIFSKLSVSNRVQAITRAKELNLL